MHVFWTFKLQLCYLKYDNRQRLSQQVNYHSNVQQNASPTKQKLWLRPKSDLSPNLRYFGLSIGACVNANVIVLIVVNYKHHHRRHRPRLSPFLSDKWLS